MAPKNVRHAVDIANRRQEIIDRLQHAINIKVGLVHGAYIINQMSVSTSIHRDDMHYITTQIIPKLRDVLHGGDGEPIPETFQVMGWIEIDGVHVCDGAPCHCVIRRTLNVKITKRQNPHPLDANGNQ